MAAPVVTGLAALIRSYYPKLTAMQVKEIILKSVVKIDHKVTLKDGDGQKRLAFEKLCSSGGIVNAYNALKLAATY
jgi:subtilisin family serine protease